MLHLGNGDMENGSVQFAERGEAGRMWISVEIATRNCSNEMIIHNFSTNHKPSAGK